VQFLAFLLPALMACQTQGEATEIMCQAPVVCEACAGADPETGERQKLLAEYLAANITNRSVSALIEHLATASPQYRPALLDSHLQGMEIGDCPYRELLGPILTENNAPLLISPDEYPFLTGATVRATPLESRFPAPAGYQRMSVPSDSFGEWLRGLPTAPGKAVVRSYAGKEIPAPAAAVVPIDIGSGNIQQCADSILRLHAEYQWKRGTADALSIHFTSGDESNWKDWREGERFEVAGSRVKRIKVGAVSNTHREFRKWLQHSFLYAGTQSLKLDAQPVPITEALQPGDFFVTPGSPGHAIIVLDVAEAPGKPPVALMGQGFMPAQSFHVLKDQGDHVIDGWFVLPTKPEDRLVNPSWSSFPRNSALRFP